MLLSQCGRCLGMEKNIGNASNRRDRKNFYRQMQFHEFSANFNAVVLQISIHWQSSLSTRICLAADAPKSMMVIHSLCRFLTGYPEPRLYWFKNGQPLKASDRILKIDRRELHSLEILNVVKSDAGQYSIFLINSAGSAYSSARLVVRGGYWPILGTQFSLFQ